MALMMVIDIKREVILNGTWLACFEYETSGDAGSNPAHACIREWIGLWCGLGGVGSEEYAWRSMLGGVRLEE